LCGAFNDLSVPASKGMEQAATHSLGVAVTHSS